MSAEHPILCEKNLGDIKKTTRLLWVYGAVTPYRTIFETEEGRNSDHAKTCVSPSFGFNLCLRYC